MDFCDPTRPSSPCGAAQFWLSAAPRRIWVRDRNGKPHLSRDGACAQVAATTLTSPGGLQTSIKRSARMVASKKSSTGSPIDTQLSNFLLSRTWTW